MFLPSSTASARPGFAEFIVLACASFVSGVASELENNLIGADGPLNAISRSGTNVYVGGRFTQVAGVTAYNVAWFDGLAWRPLGDLQANGLDGEVFSLAIVGNGTNGQPRIVVGGSFKTAGGIAATNIAIWSDSHWQEAHGGVNGRVLAMEATGVGLFVGGEFTAPHNYLALYNIDSGWSSRGGANGTVQALALGGIELVVGGRFTEAGGQAAHHIALLDITGGWQTLTKGTSAGTDGPVWALGVQLATPARSKRVFVGGRFDAVNVPAPQSLNEDTNRRPVLANNIAYYDFDTGSWHAVASTNDAPRNGAAASVSGGGVSGQPPSAFGPLARAIAVDGENVYVGGSFLAADGTLANNIARWNGSSWRPWEGIFGGGIEGTVHALNGDAQGLWVGGEFDVANFRPASNLAVWREGARANWSVPGAPELAEGSSATNIPPSNSFQRVSSFASSIDTLAANPSFIYANGPIILDDASRSDVGVWRWNTRVWRRIGQPRLGINPVPAQAMTFSQGDLCIGGTFDNIDGTAATNVAVRFGGGWEQLGHLPPSGVSAIAIGVFALASRGSDIYATGNFGSGEEGTNYVTLNGIAQLHRGPGAQWQPVGQGLFINIGAQTIRGAGGKMLFYGGDLYVSGTFDFAVNENGTQVPAKNFARWDGHEWHAVAGISVGRPLTDMVTDGRNFYVAGQVLVGNSFVLDSVAQWDGFAWRGLKQSAYAGSLAIYRKHLYAGGLGELSGFGIQQILSPLWRWDGSQWSRIGAPDSWKRIINGVSMPVQVRDLIVRDDELFAAGEFTQAGGVSSRGMVRYILLPSTLAEWRTLHFSPAQQVDPLASADDADPDGDGMTNLEEFQAGTDPWDAESRFDIDPFELKKDLASNGAVRLSFVVVAHRTYTVQFRDGTDPWRKLVDIPAHDVAHLERVVDRAPTAVFRIYRLVTPAVP